MPADLMRAIAHANRVLDWMDNLAEEEMPPEWMWPFDEEINSHLDQVMQDRKDKYSNPSPSGGDDGTMMSNEFARDRG